MPAGRATQLNRSMVYSTISAIITALPIIVTFTSAMLRMAHKYGVAILFIVALVFFVLSRVDLAREPRIAFMTSIITYKRGSPVLNLPAKAGWRALPVPETPGSTGARMLKIAY